MAEWFQYVLVAAISVPVGVFGFFWSRRVLDRQCGREDERG